MEDLKKTYINLCKEKSDINEHLPTLYSYSKKCNSVTEFGVRSCLSTNAFLYGLCENKNKTTYIGVDPFKHENVSNLENLCKNTNIEFKFIEDSDLNINIDKTDLLFIDSWHCYGQLIRELNLHHTNVNKYIILHDTTVDEFSSEIVRMPHRWQNPTKPIYQQIIKDSGFSEYELVTGLWPAVEKFLTENSEWKLKERFTNNNGLTILEKII
jgi:hypothetical protein